MKQKLTTDEKAEIKQLLDSDHAIPVEFLPALFPDGDGTIGDRERTFQANTKRLPGTNWTALPQLCDSYEMPSAEAQAAWAWRREIWHVHFGCAELLHRAYRPYTTGWYSDANGWDNLSRVLLRYGLLVGALTLHNGLEDRIAQLFNSFLAAPLKSRDVSFSKIFKNTRENGTMPETWAAAQRLRDDPNWKKNHNLANEVKHRWTGEFVPHLEEPSRKRARLFAEQAKCGNRVYEQPGLVGCAGSFLPSDWRPADEPSLLDMRGRIMAEEQKTAANLDAICGLLQTSLNKLADLAECLDAEIDWPSRGLQWQATPESAG